MKLTRQVEHDGRMCPDYIYDGRQPSCIRRMKLRRFRRVTKTEVHIMSLAVHDATECAHGVSSPYGFDIDHDGRREILATKICGHFEDYELSWDFEEDRSFDCYDYEDDRFWRQGTMSKYLKESKHDTLTVPLFELTGNRP